MNDSSGVAGMPISARDRHVTASSNQTFSTKAACLTRPSNVVREGTSDRRACSSVSPSRQAFELPAVLVEERPELGPGWLIDDVLGGRRWQGRHEQSLSGPPPTSQLALVQRQ